MNKSTIEAGQSEQMPNSDSNVDEMQVSPSIANAPVSSSRYDCDRLANVKLVKHETIKSILAAHYNEPEQKVYDVKITADLFDGTSRNMTVGEEAKAIENMGLWGFALTEENEIHYWIGNDNKKEDLVFFIAHELGHLVGEEDADDMHEEFRADSYAYVALKAFELAASLGCC